MIRRAARESAFAGRIDRRSRGTAVLLLTAVTAAALALTLLLLPPAAFASFYGDGLYPALSTIFSTLTSWTPLPLGLATAPILCGIFVWRTLLPGRRLPLAGRLIRLLLLAALLLSLYLVTWGVNYRRPPLLQLLDVAAREVTQEELDAFAGELLAWVKAAAAELEEGDGVAEPLEAGVYAAGATGDALKAISAELELLSLELGWPATVPPRVKLLPAGSLLSSGYAGMLFPFTLEPQLDAGLTSVSKVATGAHELAHAAGFADEADADLAALLAGLRAPHPLARYATSLTLLSRSLPSLSQEQGAFIVDGLPERAWRDLREARERNVRYFEPSLAARVTALYNSLLEGQGVEAGVGAYQQAPGLAALLASEGVLPPAPPRFPDTGVDDSIRPVWGRYEAPLPAAAVQSLATLGR